MIKMQILNILSVQCLRSFLWLQKQQAGIKIDVHNRRYTGH